jgi:hypothetical protein
MFTKETRRQFLEVYGLTGDEHGPVFLEEEAVVEAGSGEMKANDFQVGGDHYKSSYEVWDLVINTGMGFLEGNAVKCLCRWKRLKGEEDNDLRKALHYVNKLLENVERLAPFRGERHYGYDWCLAEVHKFCCMNKLGELETVAVTRLASWEIKAHIERALDSIIKLLEDWDRAHPQIMTEDGLLRGLEDLGR